MTRSRFGRLNVAGIPAKVCSYFAAHPGAALDSRDLEERFGLTVPNVSSTLAPAVRAGFLVRRRTTFATFGGGSHRTLYSAGPRLGGSVAPDEDDDGLPLRVIRPAGTWERKHTAGLAPAHWLEGLAA